MSTLWQAVLEADEAGALLAETLLEGEAFSLTRYRPDTEAPLWRLEAIFTECPDEAWLTNLLGPNVVLAQVPEADWVAEAQKFLPPVQAGRFHVHGSHTPRHPNPGMVDLVIDAGAAFGTGQHESTRGCLLAIDRIFKARRFSHALDVGCGTGVLALVMVKAGRALDYVVATDFDPVATKLTAENARRNGVLRFVHTGTGPGLQPAVTRAHAPYPLVVANILARPLAKIAKNVAKNLEPGGVVILAGLLARQAPYVLAAYRHQGLSLWFSIDLGSWRTLVLRCNKR